MRLHECLDHAPYATLLRIAHHYGVTIGHDCRRAHVLDRLLAASLVPLVRRELARAHAGPTLAPLQLLAECGGHGDRAAFERLFGPCAAPRYGPIPPHPAGPWLAARGLIFAWEASVVMPDELVAHVPRPQPAPAVPTPPGAAVAAPFYDLALLLADARHGRLAVDRRSGRIARRALARLLSYGTPAMSADGLLFLAEVAVVAGLLAPTADAALLRPGPAIDSWLAATPAARITALWQGWVALDRTGRRVRAAHTCRDCPSLRAALIRRLVAHPAVPLADEQAPSARAASPLAGVAGEVVSLGPGELALLHAALPCVHMGLCPTERGAADSAAR